MSFSAFASMWRRTADAGHRPSPHGKSTTFAPGRAHFWSITFVGRCAGKPGKKVKRRRTVLLSEQNAAFATSLTERTYIIDMGMIRYEGETKDLIENQEIRKKYLMI